MVRVIIFLLLVFIVWVLYASGFEKPRKIRISIIAVLLCVIAFWFDGYDKREFTNLVELNSVTSCGIDAEFSYRTNFDFDICIENKADKGTLTRLHLAIVAQDCSQSECVDLQRVERNVLVDVAPGSKLKLTQNLSFDKVDLQSTSLNWAVEVLAVKAHR